MKSNMTPTEVREALDTIGVLPSRRMGQNFLSDAAVSAGIVDLLDIKPEDTIVEIGPGLGALTEHIVGKCRKLLLLEMDSRLASRLRRKYADDPSVEVVECDAVQHDVRPLFAEAPVKVIGNLPYSSAGAIMKTFLDSPSPAERAVFMLQKEVGDRLRAVPRTKDYGVLTLFVQSGWIPKRTKTVPPGCFHPRPAVDSDVLILDKREAGSLPVFDETLFRRLVKMGFGQRRKQLRKLLPPPPAPLDISPTARAEELTLEDWISVTNQYDEHPLKELPQNAEEVFDVVDANDEVTGQATRHQVHSEGLIHRAIHIFVLNPAGELFLQKRSHLKDVHPGAWDSSAAGHLDSGEDYDVAAVRELEEELGISAIELHRIAKLPPSAATGQEHVVLYRADVGKKAKLRYPCSEIETGAFFPIEVIEAWAKKRPQDFAGGFLECWKAFTKSA